MRKSPINVSFVIIAYNEELAIGACIESIEKQNDLKSYELIVINDASTDRTAEVVTKYATVNRHIKLATLPTNMGRGYARDAGVKLTKGAYIAFVDADIILPKHWLSTCMKHIATYDAVGGVAVPDGDVGYIYSQLNLKPKHASHTATVTGSNGLYHKTLFDRVNFDVSAAEGEDFAFNQQMEQGKCNVFSIPTLTVEHREHKTFENSLAWLYKSGIGASRLLFQFRKIRLPDITFFAFLLLTSLTAGFVVLFHTALPILLIPVYILLVSAGHLQSKFYLGFEQTGQIVLGILLNTMMISAYYLGRLRGITQHNG